VAVGASYQGLAPEWDSGAGHVYRPLGAALVGTSPVPLSGRLVLDVGCGTGAVAEAAAARGALVIAADLTVSMVAYQGAPPWLGVAADALDLPFPPRAFEVAFAGFLLNQLSPAPALAELARAVRSGGAVLASTWSAETPDPVKTAIDTVLRAWGWSPPAWYLEMKTDVEPISGFPGPLVAAAEQVGLVEARATVRSLDLGLRDPSAVVAYRLAMPHIAPWVRELDEQDKIRLTRSAVAAAAIPAGGWRPAVIFLSCRAPASLVAGQPRAPR
jgi:SAM-dependent methyltransferase